MLTSWILSLMVAMQPEAPWKDTYASTASAIDQAVHEEEPLFENDPVGREKTAALLVSLAWFESTFRPNAVGGRGRLRGLYQIGGRGDLSDPLRASRAAIELLRDSFRACAARPVEERLVVYAAGGTTCKEARPAVLKKSRDRVAKARWLVKRFPPPPPPEPPPSAP